MKTFFDELIESERERGEEKPREREGGREAKREREREGGEKHRERKTLKKKLDIFFT